MKTYKLLFCLFAWGLSIASWAQTPNQTASEREFQRQLETERQRREQIEQQAPTVHLPQEVGEELTLPDHESPCQTIRKITLTGEASERFQWAIWAAEEAFGRCLGTQGINVVMVRIQNAIIDKGYVTTRVLVAPQDLSTGVLNLSLLVGKVSDIRFSPTAKQAVSLNMAVPIRKGDILNLRDLEQGLENLRRAPTVTTDIQIAPGAEAGESELVIDWQQPLPWRASLSVDDSGTKSTGRYQGTVTASWDNLFGLSDLLYVSLGHSLERSNPYGTYSNSLYYSVPIGYYQFTATLSNYNYKQTIAGYQTDYVYSGVSHNASLEVSRVLHRTGKGKTSASLSAWFSKSGNDIDGERIDVQSRRMGGWEASLAHQQFIGNASIDGDFRARRGTGAFKAIAAPEELFDEGTSRAAVVSTNIRATIPFQIAQQSFRYIGQWRQQWARNKLIARDRFTIGGRHTVRGYDGEYSLSADNGFVMRNELAWSFNLAGGAHELYAAFDVGHVHGPDEAYLLGRTLTGTAQGIRGAIKNVNYDFFIGQPVSRPDRYPTDDFVTGFNLSTSF